MEQWELDEKRNEFIKDFYYDKLNFCGCGSPWDTLYTIRGFLNCIKKKTDRYELEDYNRNSNIYYDIYQEELKLCLNLQNEIESDDSYSINEGVYQILFNVLNNCDVLEHGSSIGGSWLTKYGNELLMHLNQLTIDDFSNVLD